ncbi:hypothetical protein DPEC_G00032680 [Dallia pectoralis]|uniref:Uncharacterized protein n=1 Tax=Dallia pectoralis TaxID=75939 RepID=A0ACC2HCY0_DALPE|nr:hypothetical protein DPEC_G00032680 [Dallia pectoralis]
MFKGKKHDCPNTSGAFHGARLDVSAAELRAAERVTQRPGISAPHINLSISRSRLSSGDAREAGPSAVPALKRTRASRHQCHKTRP